MLHLVTGRVAVGVRGRQAAAAGCERVRRGEEAWRGRKGDAALVIGEGTCETSCGAHREGGGCMNEGGDEKLGWDGG